MRVGPSHHRPQDVRVFAHSNCSRDEHLLPDHRVDVIELHPQTKGALARAVAPGLVGSLHLPAYRPGSKGPDPPVGIRAIRPSDANMKPVTATPRWLPPQPPGPRTTGPVAVTSARTMVPLKRNGAW